MVFDKTLLIHTLLVVFDTSQKLEKEEDKLYIVVLY